jgi:very-short-patch-repair endonuclease
MGAGQRRKTTREEEIEMHADELKSLNPTERLFLMRWNSARHGPPELTPQHRFHPTRKWAFDFAHVPSKTAIEIDGGMWRGNRGGHTSGAGATRDREKDLSAIEKGWHVVRLTPAMAKDHATLRVIRELIKEREIKQSLYDESVTGEVVIYTHDGLRSQVDYIGPSTSARLHVVSGYAGHMVVHESRLSGIPMMT